MNPDPHAADESSTAPGPGTASTQTSQQPAKPEKPKVKPGRHWYVVTLVGLLLTVGGGVVLSVLGFNAPGQMLRFTPPATETIEFEDAGSYSVFLEGTSAATGFVTGPTIEVAAIDGSQTASVVPFLGNMSYEIGGVSGDGIATIRIPEAGTYEVRVGPLDEPGQVAIDYDGTMGFRFLGWAIGGIFLAAFGGFFWVVVFLVLLIVRVVRTNRVRRQAQQPAGWQHGGYPPQQYPPAAQQPYPQQPYPQQGYPQPGHPQQGHPQPGYPQPAYPQPAYPQPAPQQPQPAPAEHSQPDTAPQDAGDQAHADQTPPDKQDPSSS